MNKQSRIESEMIELNLQIQQDQQQLHELKHVLKDRISILAALTNELQKIREDEHEELTTSGI